MSEEYLKMRVELTKEDFPDLSYEEIKRRIKETDEWIEKNRIVNPKDYKLEKYNKKSVVDFFVKDGKSIEEGESFFDEVYNYLSRRLKEETVPRTPEKLEDISARMSMRIVYSIAELAAQINKD